MEKEEINGERVWLQRLIAGEEDAFAYFYKKFNRSIYHFIFKYVKSSPMAEDLTQEVFIKIWENRETLYNVQSFKNYLFVTSRNHTLNAMKKAFRSEAAMGVMISSFVSTRNTIEEDVIHGEYLEFLNSVLNSLPQRTRDIFKMCREQGKSYDEVATELGISRNAVKNHMVASIKALSLSVRKELGLPLSVFLIILHYH